MSDNLSKMGEDCICLLSYVSKHRDEKQTYRSLAKDINAPVKTVWWIIEYAREEGGRSMLGRMAQKYGYTYYLMPPPKIIDVEKITLKY